MFMQFDLNQFIARHVTGRPESLLTTDLSAHASLLRERIAGRSVLVIGGAGTIGAAFIRALLPYQPGRLYVVDTNENGLTELTRDLRSTSGLYIPADYKPYPFSFGDPILAKILQQEGPFDIVAHFAAHKHVRSEKDHYSVQAMVENNVLRTHQLLQLLAENPPERFFGVSTDKAANPVNLMGASKKLMEEALLAYGSVFPIVTARFANVAFSNGSLPDGFLQRLLKRQPLSAPSDVRRYFVSAREAGELCLVAGMLGESREIFFPKLGEEQMKTFSDIAVALLAALGMKAQLCASEAEARTLADAWTPASKTYPVFFFESDTSGEKPFEEFYTDTEQLDTDRFHALGIVKAQARYTPGEVSAVLQQLHVLFQQPILDKQRIVAAISDLLPEFQHMETGKGLDQRM